MMVILTFYLFVTSLKKGKNKKVVAQGTFSDFNRVWWETNTYFSHASASFARSENSWHGIEVLY